MLVVVFLFSFSNIAVCVLRCICVLLFLLMCGSLLSLVVEENVVTSGVVDGVFLCFCI